MAIVTGDRYLELLAAFIDHHAEQLLEGSVVLKLNPVGLLYLQSRLASLKELEDLRINAPVDYLRAYITDLGDYRQLEKLRRFLLLLESVQVVSLTKGSRDPTPINLLPFGRLRVLELRGCDLSTCSARGLVELRPCLEKLICHNSANALQHIFLERVVDASLIPWVCLSTVVCSKNGVLLMDDALRVLPAVRTLDLSRNALTKVANLEHCTRLRWLDIGFNHINAVDSLRIGLSNLTTLVLRGNAISNTRGLEELRVLEKLDLGYNLLSSLTEVARLQGLSCLSHLWLDGNPLASLKKYRLQTLSLFAEPFKLLLDGRRASGFEKLLVRGSLHLHRRDRSGLRRSSFGRTCDILPQQEASCPPAVVQGVLADVETTTEEGTIHDYQETHGESQEILIMEQRDLLQMEELGSPNKSVASTFEDPMDAISSSKHREEEGSWPTDSWLLEFTGNGTNLQVEFGADENDMLGSTNRRIESSMVRRRSRSRPKPPPDISWKQIEKGFDSRGDMKSSNSTLVAGNEHGPSEHNVDSEHLPFVLPNVQIGRFAEDLVDDSTSQSGTFDPNCLNGAWSPAEGVVYEDASFKDEDKPVRLGDRREEELRTEQSNVSDDNESSSTSVEWSDSESGMSNACSPATGADSTIGRLMLDFESRFGQRDNVYPSSALEGADEGSGSDVSGKWFSRRMQSGESGPQGADWEFGGGTWRSLKMSWDEGKSEYDRLLTVAERGPRLDDYRDDAMATAGGGFVGNRRPLRRVKWVDRTSTDEEDELFEKFEPLIWSPQFERNADTEWTGQAWKDTPRQIDSGSSGRHRKVSEEGPNIKLKASLRSTEASTPLPDDELEVCFRRTVGDQKTAEHSIGYLRCGCLRVWKEEREESPTILLFSSDLKVYILREEISQSALTHRQDLVLRVIASHRLTDVKRLVVGLGLQVLRLHAGAASEYVIATRSATVTSDLLQRLTTRTDAEASERSLSLNVECWGTEQLCCLEKDVFSKRKTNVRLYAMLHYRCDTETGGRWMAVTFIMTSRSLVLCSELLHLFAHSLVANVKHAGFVYDQNQEHEHYYVPHTQRAIGELRKIVPSRKDRRQLSLVFFSSDSRQPSIGTPSDGSRGLGSDHSGFTVWELRFATPAILQQILPLLKAAWAETKDQVKGVDPGFTKEIF